MKQEQSTPFSRLLMVGVLSLGAVTTSLNITLLSPLLPHIAKEFSLSEAAAGQLGALTAASAAVVAILVTPLIDRYPRRLVLQVEAILLSVATVLASAAGSAAAKAAAESGFSGCKLALRIFMRNSPSG